MNEIYKVGRGTKIYEPVIILKTGREIIIGDKCSIGQFVFIAARKFTMEQGSEIAPGAIIGGGGNVTIGKFSTVDFGAKLIPASDRPDAKYMCSAASLEDRKIVRGSITLGEGVFIGANAVICVTEKNPNIHIGNFAVIGAGSYIDKSIEAKTIIHPKTLYERRIRK